MGPARIPEGFEIFDGVSSSNKAKLTLRRTGQVGVSFAFLDKFHFSSPPAFACFLFNNITGEVAMLLTKTELPKGSVKVSFATGRNKNIRYATILARDFLDEKKIPYKEKSVGIKYKATETDGGWIFFWTDIRAPVNGDNNENR